MLLPIYQIQMNLFLNLNIYKCQENKLFKEYNEFIPKKMYITEHMDCYVSV
jgi:hypothetical protein